jgi:ketosteroid isomerase-like protein
MRTLHPLLAAVLLLAACQPAATPAGLAEADRAAIQKATEDAQAHFNAQPADFRAHANGQYTADAVFMPPNMAEIKGADNIGNWMASYPAINNTKFTIVDLDGSGDLAYVHGTYEMDVTPPGMTVAMHDKGKYVEIWKKQSDGSWKIVRDIFNSDMPVTVQDTSNKVTGKKKP